MRRAALLAVMTWLWSPPLSAEDHPCPPPDGAPVTVATVLDGHSLRLDNRETVRLAGILAPVREAPYSTEAKAALHRLTEGASLRLARTAPVDRYGRIRAHLYTDSPASQWIQGALLADGAARVMTQPDDRACAQTMMAREAQARAAARGLWRHNAYAPHDAQTMDAKTSGYHIVTGRIASVSARSGTLYINFAEDWRRDFTLRAQGAAVGRLTRNGLTADALEGRQVRVRGWVRDWNGPLMDLTHREQIERLGSNGPRPPGPPPSDR